MDRITAVLARTPLFDGLPMDQLQAFGRIAALRRCSRGEVIFTDGQPASGIFVVASGRVKIYKSSPDGREQILHIFGPGQPFGEVAVFAGEDFPATAQTLEACRLVFIPRQALVDLIGAHPTLALALLAILSRRLRRFTRQIESLSLQEVPARLAGYLLFLAGGTPGSGETQVHLPISKVHLAALLGTIPETLSRVFARLASSGLITVAGRRITLHDRTGLRDVMDGGTPSRPSCDSAGPCRRA